MNDDKISDAFIMILFLLFVVVMLNCTLSNETLYNVKSGKKTLLCFLHDGVSEIDKDLVTDFDESTGYWIFTNGYAKNCYTK